MAQSDLQDDPLNIILHCRNCTNSCCHNDIIVATKAERQRILDAGHQDHFHHVSCREQDYFLLDFHGDDQVCPYLTWDGLCSVQSVKPDLCAVYPARLNSANEIVFKDSCPASRHLTDAFVDAVRGKVMQIYYHNIPPRVYDHVVKTHLRRQAPNMLGQFFETMQRFFHRN